MERIAWFGTGLMGAAFVEALRERNERVVVYNRTFEKARALERFGARAVAEPAAAAAGATRLHVMLRDDAAVDELLSKISPAIERGAVIIDHSTVSPAGVRARAERLGASNIAFVHAPVFMAPAAARSRGGVMLASGPQTVFDRVRTELEAMTAHLWYLGERPDKAAAFKLFGNELLFFVTAGLADMYALAESVDISRSEAFELFAHFQPGAAFEGRGKTMAAADYTTHFELTMARKDARLMLETAAAADRPLHVLPAIAARMDELIASGHGGEDLAVLGIDDR